MRIPYDYVLVKPISADEITLSNGLKLFYDTYFEETKNAPSTGIVLAVPEKLRYSEKQGDPSLDFDTDMELEIGDTVIFNYLTQQHVKSEGAYDGDGNYFIHYDKIFVALRGEKVICLNGYVVVEPTQTVIASTLKLPTYLKNKKSKMKGVVRHCGTPVRRYRFFPELPPDETVKEGDNIIFHNMDAVPLQQNQAIHGLLSKDTVLFKMQYKDIVATDNENQYQPSWT